MLSKRESAMIMMIDEAAIPSQWKYCPQFQQCLMQRILVAGWIVLLQIQSESLSHSTNII